MMKTKIFLTVMFASLAIISATGRNSNIVQRNIDVSTFSAISASGGWDVIVRQGDKQSVSIEVSEEVLDRAVIKVKDGTLHIYNKHTNRIFSWNVARDLVQKAIVTVTDLHQIEASGGVDVFFATPLVTDDFEVAMSGGSDFENLSLNCTNFTGSFSGGSDAKIRFLSVRNIKVNLSGGSDIELLDINAQKCGINASGGCDLKLMGHADKLTISASGGSDVFAADFIVRDCSAAFSGSADGQIHVSDRLNISVSGASDVVCYGNPCEVEKSVHKNSSLKMR